MDDYPESEFQAYLEGTNGSNLEPFDEDEREAWTRRQYIARSVFCPRRAVPLDVWRRRHERRAPPARAERSKTTPPKQERRGRDRQPRGPPAKEEAELDPLTTQPTAHVAAPFLEALADEEAELSEADMHLLDFMADAVLALARQAGSTDSGYGDA